MPYNVNLRMVDWCTSVSCAKADIEMSFGIALFGVPTHSNYTFSVFGPFQDRCSVPHPFTPPNGTIKANIPLTQNHSKKVALCYGGERSCKGWWKRIFQGLNSLESTSLPNPP